jgi:formylmethanofuran dehydrogenase subunit C
MPLTLTLKRTSNVPLEVEGITPDGALGKSLAEIEKLPIFQGNAQLPLAEFFSVAGDPADETIHWEGPLAGVHWIGAKMASGRMTIHGDCGRHLGSEMSGGEIHVLGSASDWVGGEMHGGLIHVRGNAGHLVGAAYRGSARGMTRGTILIGGNAGNEIGHTLRRGLIAIGGDCGDLAGFNMLAGTILLCGSVGIRHGAGMRRGTICIAATNGRGFPIPPLLPSFRRACRYRPEVLSLVDRQLRKLEFQVAEEFVTSFYDLYNGDLIEGGRGEILLRVAA